MFGGSMFDLLNVPLIVIALALVLGVCLIFTDLILWRRGAAPSTPEETQTDPTVTAEVQGAPVAAIGDTLSPFLEHIAGAVKVPPSARTRHFAHLFRQSALNDASARVAVSLDAEGIEAGPVAPERPATEVELLQLELERLRTQNAQMTTELTAVHRALDRLGVAPSPSASLRLVQGAVRGNVRAREEIPAPAPVKVFSNSNGAIR